MAMSVWVKGYLHESDHIHANLPSGELSHVAENRGIMSKVQIFDHEPESTMDVSDHYGEEGYLTAYHYDKETDTWSLYGTSNSFIFKDALFEYDVPTGTITAPPPCTCTAWVNAECTASSKRRQTRMCTPAGCDIEDRIIDDSTCVPPEGTLSITTSPTGASIMVDGVTKTSPCSFSLAQEIYTVTISKAGYDTIMDNVNIIAGATTTKSYTLTLSKKIITFESVPAGATVKVV